jgi:peptidyl-prolyl cis-trans isomerase SurA
MKDDYQKLQALAFEKKQKETREKWIERYRKEFFIQINPPYSECPQLKGWGSNK